ncbi:MAG TPA: ATP synthase F0 subunit C [Terriglobia bacterium]|nr:ATP synthase F0 subunit C [Terriglobia bacterium]
MKQKFLLCLTGIVSLLLAAPLFAQGGSAPAATAGTNWPAFGGVLALGLAAGLCGLGQGKATSSACEGVARNPGARPHVFLFLILGLVFIETLTLYTLAIVIFKT